jgi:hypothetical protein
MTFTAHPAPPQEAERVPRWTRWFVWSFLGAFIACGVAGIEAWPLTGWRLFSHLRHEHAVSWQAVAVDGRGRETPVVFGRLPFAYRGASLILKTFQSLAPADREAVCEAWEDALRARGAPAGAIRVYRIDRDLFPRNGPRPANPSVRTLRFTCAGGSVDATAARTAGGASRAPA